MEDGCLKYGICHGVVTNAGIDAGSGHAGIEAGRSHHRWRYIVDKLCRVIELLQEVLEDSCTMKLRVN